MGVVLCELVSLTRVPASSLVVSLVYLLLVLVPPLRVLAGWLLWSHFDARLFCVSSKVVLFGE